MNNVALIPLFWRGLHVTDALVDEADWQRLSKLRWSVAPLHRMTREIGYPMTRINGGMVSMDRAVFGIGVGDPRSVHHVNQVKYDNRRSNLVVYPTRNAHQIQADHPANHLERVRLGRDLVRQARADLGLPPLRSIPWRELAAIRFQADREVYRRRMAAA